MLSTGLFLFILAFVVLCRNAAAYFYTENECMHIRAQENKIDLNRLEGKWYEYSKYPSPMTLENRCVSFNFAVSPDNDVNLNINYRKFGVDSVLSGTGALSADGQISIHFDQNLGVWQDIKYSVVEMDNLNYLILFACKRESPKLNHYNNLFWVLTRKSILSEVDEVNMFRILNKHNILLWPLIRTNQRNCELHTPKSDEDTENNQSADECETTTIEPATEITTNQNAEWFYHTHLPIESIISSINDDQDSDSESYD